MHCSGADELIAGVSNMAHGKFPWHATFKYVPIIFFYFVRTSSLFEKDMHIYRVSQGNVPGFVRLFLKLKYADLTKTSIFEVELLRR